MKLIVILSILLFVTIPLLGVPNSIGCYLTAQSVYKLTIVDYTTVITPINIDCTLVSDQHTHEDLYLESSSNEIYNTYNFKLIQEKYTTDFG